MRKPDYHQNEEFKNRSLKLAEIRELGLEPYPATFSPKQTTQDLLRIYESQECPGSEAAEKGETESFSLAGRIVLFRAMGKNAFAHLQDGTGRLQLMINRDHTYVQGFTPTAELSHIKFIEKKVDLGDIIGVEGNIFRTHKGELTLYVKSFTLLCKSLLPLPDKHSGLVDKGVRYRKRWLDLITHPEVRETFKLRSKIFQFVRKTFEEAGFLEVETPILQNIYGGAEARPFTTHLHALNQDMFLRIALEISLKKLIIGGMDKVFEISKIFRNEGIDRTHNPEFTMLEAYASYWDYNDMMVFVETLFEKLSLELFGKPEVTLEKEGISYTIHLKAPWKRISMVEAIREYGKIETEGVSDQKLREILKKADTLDPKEIDKAPRGILISLLFEEFVEKHLIQPHHIIDHPLETTPLCKLHRDPHLRKKGFVERFESFILASEICNSYTELNDPELQRTLLEKQHQAKQEGNEEAHPLDEEFLEAICQGMPPTAGIGIGMDRLVMLFTKEPSIRDVLYFPLMRPETEGE